MFVSLYLFFFRSFAVQQPPPFAYLYISHFRPSVSCVIKLPRSKSRLPSSDSFGSWDNITDSGGWGCSRNAPGWVRFGYSLLSLSWSVCLFVCMSVCLALPTPPLSLSLLLCFCFPVCVFSSFLRLFFSVSCSLSPCLPSSKKLSLSHFSFASFSPPWRYFLPESPALSLSLFPSIGLPSS